MYFSTWRLELTHHHHTLLLIMCLTVSSSYVYSTPLRNPVQSVYFSQVQVEIIMFCPKGPAKIFFLTCASWCSGVPLWAHAFTVRGWYLCDNLYESHVRLNFIQTLNCIIYNIIKVIRQTQKIFFFHSWVNKLYCLSNVICLSLHFPIILLFFYPTNVPTTSSA